MHHNLSEQQAGKRVGIIRKCQQKAKLRPTGCMLSMLLSTTPDIGFCIFSPDWLETDQAMEVFRQRLRTDLCILTTLQLDRIT